MLQSNQIDDICLSLESFNSLPSSYQLLVPPQGYGNDYYMNCVREKPISPLRNAFLQNQQWQQYPSSDSNLPRHRREVESPTSISNVISFEEANRNYDL